MRKIFVELLITYSVDHEPNVETSKKFEYYFQKFEMSDPKQLCLEFKSDYLKREFGDESMSDETLYQNITEVYKRICAVFQLKTFKSRNLPNFHRKYQKFLEDAEICVKNHFEFKENFIGFKKKT